MSPLSGLLLLSAVAVVCLGWSLEALHPTPLCVANARYDPFSKRCKCKPGFKGSSRLCCGPENEGVCRLVSDPILNTAHDFISEISYPCTTSIAVIKNNDGGRDCSVRITVAGPYRDDGALFYNSAILHLTVDGKTRVAELIDHKRILFPKENRNQTLTEKTENTIDVDNYKFSVNVDDLDTYKVTGCGGYLVYRPPNPAVQSQESSPPGICVVAPQRIIAESLSEGEVCNLEPSFQPAPYATKEQAILASMILGYPAIVDRYNHDPPGYGDRCKSVSDNFAECRSETDKTKAIRNCGNILLFFKNRHCLNKSRNQIFELFDDCIKATCSNNQAACTRLQGNPDIQRCLPNQIACGTSP
ncbi:uncharacterized protein LOC106050427 [Biomphalaria glabrata]|uniref:Uncharacterized protein LOC106050427 n=1 Tax=Biomphalaria glabrata TaxID=6526 RepID=A0A9W3BC86_BIOGL|nr:uncharacterized protein LOC106050427 [Biomphalaria glabrata]